MIGGGHVIMSDTSSTTNSNYELGSYSITVRVTGKTEGVRQGVFLSDKWGGF